MSGLSLLIVLLAATGASALAVIQTQHQHRQQFAQWQALKAEREELEIEWGRLLLEESTLATPQRIEALARGELGLRAPQPGQIRVIRP